MFSFYKIRGEWTAKNKFKLDTTLDNFSESKLAEHYWRKVDRYTFEWQPPPTVYKTLCPTQICSNLILRKQII